MKNKKMNDTDILEQWRTTHLVQFTKMDNELVGKLMEFAKFYHATKLNFCEKCGDRLVQDTNSNDMFCLKCN
jgi:NADH pyrophosphatase NudC (nudix superfamily)